MKTSYKVHLRKGSDCALSGFPYQVIDETTYANGDILVELGDEEGYPVEDISACATQQLNFNHAVKRHGTALRWPRRAAAAEGRGER